MKAPKNTKGGFAGQMNAAAAKVKADVGKKQKKSSQKSQGMPTVQEKVSNRLYGQPKGKAVTGIPDSMMSRLKPMKKGF